MARISGVNLPNKPVAIALTYIYRVGRTAAVKIFEAANVAGVSIPLEQHWQTLPVKSAQTISVMMNCRGFATFLTGIS